MKTIEVVAAVISDTSNRILIAKRKVEKNLGGKWEFPGGKVEDDEDHAAALERELKEEMNIVTKTRAFICSNIHHYSELIVNLHAYRTDLISGDFKLLDHDLIEWVIVDDLLSYDFAEADIPIIHKLKENSNL